MPATACGNERAMHGMRLIVDQLFAGQRGECPAGFVHQKIGGCKVPIMAVRGGERAVERTGGDPGNTQRERGNAWRRFDARLKRDERFKPALGGEESRSRDVTSGAG